MPAGRPITITDEQIQECFVMMSEGMTFKQACGKKGFDYSNAITRVTKSEVLTKLHARAREEFAHTCVQQMFDIADQEEDVQRARLKCDNVKWYAARVLPKDYGDKLQAQVSGPDGKAIPHEHVLSFKTMSDDDLNRYIDQAKKG